MRPAYWLALFILVLTLALTWWAGRLSIPSDSSTLEGQVSDGRHPVAGARVRFRGAADFVLTDERGRFRLRRSGDTRRLLVSREGFAIQGFDADEVSSALVLPRLSREDHADYAWVEPGPRPVGVNNCANCHKEIYREWSASAHAQSAANPHFLNIYDGSDWHGRQGVGWNLRADNVHGAAVCTACHAPGVSANDDAFADLRKVQGVNKHGVHCDFCHKVADAATDERGLTFGRFGYQLRRPQKGQFFLGPLDDAERAGEAFSYAPVYRQSRYCASCHEGVVFGVPVYTTYSEWLASPARKEGKQCQSCHMTPTGTLTNIAPAKGGIERDPAMLAAHLFPGTQGDMLRRCLTISVRVHSQAGRLRARVEVRAERVGHRVPTGFIDRNLLLVVEAIDGQGKPVAPQSGPKLPPLAGKRLAGTAGRLYAKQLLAHNTTAAIPFWKHAGTIRDTRLFPGRPDKSEFVFPSRANRVRVRLIYRRFWHEVAKAKRWPDNEIVVLERIWQGS